MEKQSGSKGPRSLEMEHVLMVMVPGLKEMAHEQKVLELDSVERKLECMMVLELVECKLEGSMLKVIDESN
jgi:hypothetical protein